MHNEKHDSKADRSVEYRRIGVASPPSADQRRIVESHLRLGWTFVGREGNEVVLSRRKRSDVRSSAATVGEKLAKNENQDAESFKVIPYDGSQEDVERLRVLEREGWEVVKHDRQMSLMTLRRISPLWPEAGSTATSDVSQALPGPSPRGLLDFAPMWTVVVFWVVYFMGLLQSANSSVLSRSTILGSETLYIGIMMVSLGSIQGFIGGGVFHLVARVIHRFSTGTWYAPNGRHGRFSYVFCFGLALGLPLVIIAFGVLIALFG